MSNGMKIAEVVCTFPPYKGGIGNVAMSYADLLVERGNDVSVFTPRYSRVEDEVNSFDLRRLFPVLKLGNAAFLPQLFFLLKRFDVVYLHYPFFGGAEVVFFLKLFFPGSFKLVIHYHMDTSRLGLMARILSLPAKLVKRRLFRMADKVTCASLDYVKNGALASIYEENSDKFVEIPFGVNEEKFFPGERLRKKRNFEVLFVGGLDKAHYFKGVHNLIKAFNELKRDNIFLNVVGDGDLREEYEKRVSGYGIQNVNFLGKLSDEELRKEYRRSDFFVLPSINGHEAFGLVLLEAMASGIPVIASDLPGVRGVFVDGEHGFLVEPNNVSDLVLKIREMVHNKKRMKLMGCEARKYVEKKYKWSVVGDKLNKILKEV